MTAYREHSDIAFISFKSAIFLQFFKTIILFGQNPTPHDLFHSYKATLYELEKEGKVTGQRELRVPRSTPHKDHADDSICTAPPRFL